MRGFLLFLFFYFVGWIGISSIVNAQSVPFLFQPLNWEQASALASRDNKLILVEVGNVGEEAEKNIVNNRELADYLQRNVVAIRMDMNSVQGRNFESKLLLYPWPTFAFFMPYGDLVGVSDLQEVRKNPQCLREGLEKAKREAEVKRKNSRSVYFSDLDVEEACKRGTADGKQVFVFVADNSEQASLLVEKNVLTLDEVADFYNKAFVNIRLDRGQVSKWLDECKFEFEGSPAFIYLNAQGKLLHVVSRYADKDKILETGKYVLKRAKGIAFLSLKLEQAKECARKKNKMLFVDYYIEGNAHRELVQQVFTDPEVTDFFMKNFVNTSIEGDSAFLAFYDVDGNELHRIKEVGSGEELLMEGKKVVEGKGLAGMRVRFQEGNRENNFMEEYILALDRAGLWNEVSEVVSEYLHPLSPECLKETKYWRLFERYIIVAEPAFFDYVLSEREVLESLYGEKNVAQKISALWIAGAENFVKDGVFDEEGFKRYAKRLKKEKVANWRQIVRNANMHAAEKIGDWKTFVTLAEEKWYEEKIADAELYRWGVKIFESCKDGNVRYKMAQWLKIRVMEIERKEQMSGKVDIGSYKGFFAKLSDDLLKE